MKKELLVERKQLKHFKKFTWGPNDVVTICPIVCCLFVLGAGGEAGGSGILKSGGGVMSELALLMMQLCALSYTAMPMVHGAIVATHLKALWYSSYITLLNKRLIEALTLAQGNLFY